MVENIMPHGVLRINAQVYREGKGCGLSASACVESERKSFRKLTLVCGEYL